MKISKEHADRMAREFRASLNIGKSYIGLKFHRRRGFWLDPDADQPYLFCRRCGLSAMEADSFCSGKLYSRRRQ